MTMPNTSQEIDAAIRATMLKKHCCDDDGFCMCGEDWPCQYVIQASITLKLSAIAVILQPDQAAIIGSIVNGNASGQSERRRG